MTAQDQAINIKYFKNKIFKEEFDSRSWLCKQNDENFDRLNSGCPSQAKNDMIHLLTAIGLSPGGSSTLHIYTKTVHRTTQNKQDIEQHNNFGECGPCPVLARFTLAFVLQLRRKHGKTSVMVAASKNT